SFGMHNPCQNCASRRGFTPLLPITVIRRSTWACSYKAESALESLPLMLSRRRVRCALTPETMESSGKLHELRAAESTDARRGIQLEPRQRLLCRVRTDAKVVHRVRESFLDRLMWRQVLTRRQRRKQVFKVRMKQSHQ